MDDQDVIGRINELADEEHALFQKESRGEASDQDRERLKDLGVSLDQCCTNGVRAAPPGSTPTTRAFATRAPSRATSTDALTGRTRPT
jgi:uncharacterized protein DUF2630